MKIIIILIAMAGNFGFPGNAYAINQPAKERPNQFSVSVGSSMLARQDLIYSPFVHSDQSFLSFAMKYTREKKSYQYWDISFMFNSSQRGTRTEIDMGGHRHGFNPHEFLLISSAYGIGLPLKHSERKKEWLGAALKIDLQAAFYSFVMSDMFGYYIDHSVNGWYRRHFIIGNRHNLAARIELPLISWLARPPYLAEDDGFIENISSHNKSKILLAFIKDGQFTTWNTVQRVNLDAGYSYPVAKRLNIGADYRFVFIRSAEPKTLLSVQHILNLTSTIKF